MTNSSTQFSNFIKKYSNFKESGLTGRYINFDHISKALQNASSNFDIEIIGNSVLEEPIHLIKIGEGKIKILLWSQMHGNESTTTKAVFDLINAFKEFKENSVIKGILDNCSLYIIPMLNPDGARAYTRVNANNTDLNRDAKNLTEVESRVLRQVFDDIQPDFCFNLHDQRTIFSAGRNEYPATLSFLTPSEDIKRSITPIREESMRVVASIFKDLSPLLLNRIGRYSDEYNANCTGDTFQALGTPTILFEAGHSYNDYQREKTREYVFFAIISGLNTIAIDNYKNADISVYLDIPENEKLYYDLILRNAIINEGVVDIAIQFKEVLKDSAIKFIPVVENISPKLAFFAHREIDCDFQTISLPDHSPLSENVVVEKILLKNEILMINYENN